MKKKTYKQPSMKAVEFESTDILAGSNELRALKLHKEYVIDYEEEEHPDISEEIWGSQW